MGKKRKKLHGKVEKIIKPVVSGGPEKAQISIVEGEELYREVRVENVLTDETGEEVGLKPGADVDVVVEADSNATTKKP
jgi:molybdopterin-binding protein